MGTEETLTIALTGTGALKNASLRPSAPAKPQVLQPVLLRSAHKAPRTDFDIVKELAVLRESRCKTEATLDAIQSREKLGKKRLLNRSQSVSNRVNGFSNKSKEPKRKASFSESEQLPLSNENKLKLSTSESIYQSAKKKWIVKSSNEKKSQSEYSSLPILNKAAHQQIKTQLEAEKEETKAQQRREIYALNREMKRLESDMFEAFMAAHSFPSNNYAHKLPKLKNSPIDQSATGMLDAGRV